MEWNDLRAFVAVAETGSFSAAARALHVTQPAVTKRIQALEAQLGRRLFDRAGKRTHLTDAGQMLMPRAREVLSHVQDTHTLLENLDARVGGQLRLATSHHAGLHRLAPVLRVYAQTYPDVRLDIRFVDSEVAHDLVQRAEVDLAVVTLNPNGQPQQLRYVHLWHDPLRFVASREHPLHALTTVSLEELSRHQAILPGLATYTGRIVDARFRAAGIQLGTMLSTNYLETIGMLVRIGLGWSVLPETMLSDPIAPLPVDAPSMSRTLGCVTHPYRTLPNAARAFVDVALSFADQRVEVSRSGF
jgi:DNA-binding transcriptional LysR family regulator